MGDKKVYTFRLEGYLKERLEQEYADSEYNTKSKFIRDLLESGLNQNGGVGQKIKALERKKKRLEAEREQTERHIEDLKSEKEIKDELREDVEEDLKEILMNNFKSCKRYIIRSEARDMCAETIPGYTDVHFTDRIEAIDRVTEERPDSPEDYEECAQNIIDDWFENGLIEIEGAES